MVAGGGPATLGGVLLRVFALAGILSGNNEANMNKLLNLFKNSIFSDSYGLFKARSCHLIVMESVDMRYLCQA